MLKIVVSPDPVLSQVCEPCTPGDKALVRLSKQMAHAMYKNNGCGIAAPQVGITTPCRHRRRLRRGRWRA